MISEKSWNLDIKMDMSLIEKSKFGKASLKDKNLGKSPHRSTD